VTVKLAGGAGRSPCVSKTGAAALSGALCAPIMLIMDSPGRLADRRERSCRLPAKSRAKIPAGKKQMLSILPIDLIKVVNIAAIEDGLKLSGGRGGASGLAGEAENGKTKSG
jgi:hypothetical protein